MSINFFHTSLKKAEDLINIGNSDSIEEAKNIITNHLSGATDADTQEASEFHSLAILAHNYIQHLKDAAADLHSFPTIGEELNSALNHLEKARQLGKEMIPHAKEIIKLCKEEELNSI